MNVLLPTGIYCVALLAWLWWIHHLRPARPSPLVNPAPRPSGDGSTGDGAGTPDPAPSPAPQRVHIEMGGPNRHRAA